MVSRQPGHDLMLFSFIPRFTFEVSTKKEAYSSLFCTDSAPYGESQWALLPAGSPSSMPVQPSLAYQGLFSQSAMVGIHRRGMHMTGWYPYQLPNNIIWPSEFTGTSLTLRPFGLSGYPLCHRHRAQLVCGQTSLWLLESIIPFCWSLPKAFD